ADPAAGEVEHVVELRQRGPAARRIVRHDELAPLVRVDVELDEVRADLDRALECRQRVLRELVRRAAVRDDQHQPSTRRISSTSIPSISSSAAASRSGTSVPCRAKTRIPAAFADAIPASVSSKTSTSPAGTPSTG